MSNILEKKFFYLFIILQPILDLLTSFMSRNMELTFNNRYNSKKSIYGIYVYVCIICL